MHLLNIGNKFPQTLFQWNKQFLLFNLLFFLFYYNLFYYKGIVVQCILVVLFLFWSCGTFKDNWVEFIVCCFSGRDQLLPSQEEGERLCHVLPKCEIRKFNNSGHFLLLVGFSLSLSLPRVCERVSACIHLSSFVCGFSCL